MFIKFLLFTLVFISNNSCYDYFIRYKSHDLPCLILSEEHSSIRCVFNQSDPLKFFSRNSLLNLEFVIVSIHNLTLPSNFFVDNYHNLIVFDSTEDIHFQQINLFKDTFLFPSKIHFIIHNCGHPIIQIERYSFIEQMFITYKNRSRTVSLKDYFSNECLVNEEIFINDENLIKLTKFNLLNRKKQFYATKLFINALLFSIVTSLTTILMCLIIRKPVSISYDIIQTARTSISESSPSVISHQTTEEVN
jgi:hypothetical protein